MFRKNLPFIYLVIKKNWIPKKKKQQKKKQQKNGMWKHSIDYEETFSVKKLLTRHIVMPVQSQNLYFQRHMLWSYLCSVSSVKMINDCSFFDIGGIYDHHCLIFLFIIIDICLCTSKTLRKIKTPMRAFNTCTGQTYTGL